MALNKAQTSTLAKIVIVAFGVILVIGLAGPSITALLTSLQGGGNDSTETQGTLDTLALEYQTTVTSIETVLASDPASATLLVSLGNVYFDWASRIQQAQTAPQGSDRPYWTLASIYYGRAIEAGATEPPVVVDSAITEFYIGNTTEAIGRVEGVMQASPDFAPAWYNAGIFYEQVGRSADAIAAYSRYLELDPTGTTGDTSFAEERINALSGGGAGTSTTPTGTQ